MAINEGVEFGIAIVCVFALTFAVEYVRRRRSKNPDEQVRNQYANAASSVIFLILTAAGYVQSPSGDPSILLTAAAGMQLFALGLLWIAPRARPCWPRRAPGEFGLLLFYCLAARVWCTTMYAGYIPADATGDGLIQLLEAFAAVMCVVGLVRERPDKASCKRALGLFAGVCALALVCYGELDHRADIDRLYASALYAEVTAWGVMLRWVYEQSANDPDAVDAIYVLPSLVQSACRAYSWVVAFSELTPKHGHNPILLMNLFPVVGVGAHLVMVAMIAAICTVCLRDVKLPELHACMSLV